MWIPPQALVHRSTLIAFRLLEISEIGNIAPKILTKVKFNHRELILLLHKLLFALIGLFILDIFTEKFLEGLSSS